MTCAAMGESYSRAIGWRLKSRLRDAQAHPQSLPSQAPRPAPSHSRWRDVCETRLRGFETKVCLSMLERTMEVKLLHVTVYDGDGWTWRSEDIRNPTWDHVETAIRRLDRFQYPFIGLFRSTDPEPYTYPQFNVIGGEGEFAMDSMADGAYYRYHEQMRGDEMVEIWRSDQGAAFEAKYCCPSLDTAVRATRYFCEHGTLYPDLPWQKQ